jgi:hypothetical protein
MSQPYILSSSNVFEGPGAALTMSVAIISIMINIPFLILFIFLTRKYKTGTWHWVWLIFALLTAYNIISSLNSYYKAKKSIAV